MTKFSVVSFSTNTKCRRAKEAETNVFTLASASFTESTKRPRGFHVWFYSAGNLANFA